MRILAMDVGDRWIGIAVSDLMGWTAQGIKTLKRKNKEEDTKMLSQIITQYNPEKIVLGLPSNMDGTLGPRGEKVKRFGDFLGSTVYKGEIVYWDERLTTVLANRVMLEADISRKKRKQNVDKLAAVLILQNYLDFINNKKERGEHERTQ